eukprot:53318-Prymnesium_polylepis.3
MCIRDSSDGGLRAADERAGGGELHTRRGRRSAVVMIASTSQGHGGRGIPRLTARWAHASR